MWLAGVNIVHIDGTLIVYWRGVVNMNAPKGKRRVNMYVAESIIEKVDRYAEELGLNRSAMVTVILKQYIDQQELLTLTDVARQRGLK